MFDTSGSPGVQDCHGAFREQLHSQCASFSLAVIYYEPNWLCHVSTLHNRFVQSLLSALSLASSYNGRVFDLHGKRRDMFQRNGLHCTSDY